MMRPKELEEMQQALEALEESCYPRLSAKHTDRYEEAIIALREALDHFGEANEMVVGWDRVKPDAIASDPLYQQGFVDGVEEGRNQVAEQAEQEPVAERKAQVNELIKESARLIASISDEGDRYLTAIDMLRNAYRLGLKDAAPVRTKDLTDDEIMKINVDTASIVPTCDRQFHFARAVIAADREKNNANNNT